MKTCTKCGSDFKEYGRETRCKPCVNQIKRDKIIALNLELYGVESNPSRYANEDDPRLIKAELKGILPIDDLFEGLSQSEINALDAGDINALMRI